MEIKVKSPTRFEIASSNHKVICDQPKSFGGTDEGMNPLELLVGALGSCISVFTMPIVKRRGIDLSKCSLKLDFQMSENPKRIGKIDVKLQIPEGLTEEDKKALLKAAHLCPIHSTFHNPPEINVSIE